MNYDNIGNVVNRDNFDGHRICYGYDIIRNLETTRVEGLANTATCSSVTAQGATLPTGSRKISTQWHPDWTLETKRAEPGKITTSVYNGQPDPFNGGATASCAPASALLPDGKPIVVLCRQVEQATTDTTGAQGFSAVQQTGTVNREQKWTYNQYGQILTHDGPRTDVSDVTTYVYYTDTTADHTMGDLQTMTNALGKVTSFPLYNKHGQVMSMVDPNGVTTSYTYDLRQRLKTVAVGGKTTNYDYDKVGQLTKVTYPDTSFVGYEYDDAHRLKAVYDKQGNRIDYTLDNAGNRTEEKTKDPTGNLKRLLSRNMDALGRVQQVTGRE